MLLRFVIAWRELVKGPETAEDLLYLKWSTGKGNTVLAAPGTE
jgi:hypothetical protein